MTQYPTDLTEKQWQVIKNILEPQARNRKHSLREIMNAIRQIICGSLDIFRGRYSISFKAQNVSSKFSTFFHFFM